MLCIADFLLTSTIIHLGGAEANPVVEMFIVEFGIMGILYAKAPPMMLLWLLLNQMHPYPWIRYAWVGVLTTMAGVIMYSIYALAMIS
jgi:hypothetical protein